MQDKLNKGVNKGASSPENQNPRASCVYVATATLHTDIHVFSIFHMAVFSRRSS